MDVVVLRWPAEEDRRAIAAVECAPRLLLVEPGAQPPPPDDLLEDWIRLPATEEDVRARVRGLVWRAQRSNGAHGATAPARSPELADGVLRVAERWVSLPPVEARLAAALIDRIGAVVSRDALAKAGWPQGAPGRNALDVHVLRLRRRLADVGLAIRTIRSRGYLLEPSGSGQVSVGRT